MIPETWGLNVYKEGSDDRIESSGKITFPIPELVDNKDHMLLIYVLKSNGVCLGGTVAVLIFRTVIYSVRAGKIDVLAGRVLSLILIEVEFETGSIRSTPATMRRTSST